MPNSLYIGLMSGTSLDAIDAALVDLSHTPPRLVQALSHPLQSSLREELLALTLPGDNEIDRQGSAGNRFAQAEADAVKALLQQADCSADAICAIGDHGQTVRHRPDLKSPFTLQIGNPALLAESTGIDVIADFRRRDMAAGGQGAPLVPAFHRAVFRSNKRDRVIVNIGGIANLTFLPANSARKVVGFDTGPGNLLLDLNIQRNLQHPFDSNGDWARQGTYSQRLLQQMLDEPYFALPPPKSSGRELFNSNWLTAHLEQSAPLSGQDIQATLVMLTAETIARGIDQLGLLTAEIYLCGGGAHNSVLKEALSTRLKPFKVASTELIGLHPDWVEATAFAWLAHCFTQRIPANLPAVTGANGARILGALYPA